jgi:hypothetical protein
VLLKPRTNNLYVGVSDVGGAASLVRVDAANGSWAPATSVALESYPQIVGAPSLDIGFSPNICSSTSSLMGSS